MNTRGTCDVDGVPLCSVAFLTDGLSNGLRLHLEMQMARSHAAVDEFDAGTVVTESCILNWWNLS